MIEILCIILGLLLLITLIFCALVLICRVIYGKDKKLPFDYTRKELLVVDGITIFLSILGGLLFYWFLKNL